MARAHTGPCEPVRIVSSLTTLDEPWRAALEDLARATGEGGLPWSCAGGSVELVPEPSGGAVLTITNAKGQRVSRHVGDPTEVVPTGEALLSRPIEDAAPAPPPAPIAAPPPPVAPVGPAEPRARIALSIGPRVSGPGAMAWGSGRLDVALPIGPWSLGFWARYELHLAGPAGPWQNFRTSAVSAAIEAGRRIITHPFELRATLAPSIAVVIMEEGYENLPHAEGAKPALRLGTGLSGLFPIASVFRGIVTIDGEFAPAAITGLHNIDAGNNPPRLPPVPAYTVGLLLGVEASIR